MADPALRFDPGADVSLELAYRIDRFLSLEARLLDEERYDDWLALLAPDLRYRMPVPLNAYRRNRPGATSLGTGFIYDETLDTLRQRAAREQTGMVWLNDPPTRHVRIVTNVEAFATDTADNYDVRSKVMLYRSRRERDRVSHICWREDIIRKSDFGLQIAARTIHLPERVITDKNLNMFF